MNKLLSYLFVLRYEYRDPTQKVRARVLLAFGTGAAVAVLLLELVVLLNVAAGPFYDFGASQDYLIASLTAMLAGFLLSIRLIQSGYLRQAIMIMGIILVVYNVVDLAAWGTMPTGAVFPIILIYASLAYGTRGTALAYVYTWVVLIGNGIAKSQDFLGTKPTDEIFYDVFFTGANVGISALLLWMFTGSLQRALSRANRIAAQTRAAAEAGQALAQILNLDELLTRAVDFIRDRFALYQVQIYLIDEARDYANLAASTGEIGQALMAQGYRVPIGPRTVVGEAVMNGDLLYVGDLTRKAYRRPELLANARSELAIPLRVGEEIVGVLNIHSLRVNAFGDEDIEAMRVISNQISQGIQNAQLFESQQRGLLQNRRLFLESETNLREIQRLNRQLTGRFWQEYIQASDPGQIGVQLIGQELRPVVADWTPAMQQAMARQRIVSREENGEQILAVPITIRGQAVGAIEVRLSGSQSPNEIRNVLQSVAERMAFSLENARLFEQASSAAEREQQINTITARLQGLTSIEDVLATALSTLGQTLNAEQGTIRLVTLNPSALSTDQAASSSGNGHREIDRGNGHQGEDQLS